VTASSARRSLCCPRPSSPFTLVGPVTREAAPNASRSRSHIVGRERMALGASREPVSDLASPATWLEPGGHEPGVPRTEDLLDPSSSRVLRANVGEPALGHPTRPCPRIETWRLAVVPLRPSVDRPDDRGPIPHDPAVEVTCQLSMRFAEVRAHERSAVTRYVRGPGHAVSLHVRTQALEVAATYGAANRRHGAVGLGLETRSWPGDSQPVFGARHMRAGESSDVLGTRETVARPLHACRDCGASDHRGDSSPSPSAHARVPRRRHCKGMRESCSSRVRSARAPCRPEATKGGFDATS